MTKDDFCFMLNVREELPADDFTKDERDTYKKNLDEWFKEYVSRPPFKPGTRVQILCGYWGPNDMDLLDYKGKFARIVGSYFDLFGRAHSGTITDGFNRHAVNSVEHDILHGWNNSFVDLYQYEIEIEVDGRRGGRCSWWKHSYLKEVEK